MEKLSSPFTLPCGAVIKNRFVKAAMSENIATIKGKPTSKLIHLYDVWSKSQLGLSITGNVMVDKRAKGERHNVIIENDKHLNKLQRWSKTAQSNGTALWMQINHPGRQSPKFINKEVVAPSAIGLKQSALFDLPRALKEKEIRDIIYRFGQTALIAKQGGFSGVQIHAAHGYLISQFLSPLSNVRIDDWGGSLTNRSRFVMEIYHEIRKQVGAKFPIGIKINSADFQRGGFTEDESLEVIENLGKIGIDLIEISGGTYEMAAMMGQSKKKSTRDREAYFADFIVKARKVTKCPLMLTGGFRTVEVMESALQNDELDFIGLARPLALNPNIVNEFLEGVSTEIILPKIKTNIQMIDRLGFLDVTWYTAQMERLANGQKTNPKMSAWMVFYKMTKDML